MRIRRAAVAGSWYPGAAPALAAAIDAHLARAARDVGGDLVALVAPHAGLMYSGPVAADAYRLLRDRRFDIVVLVGPSHFAGFDGVALYGEGGFETPFGVAPIDEACAGRLRDASPIVHDDAAVHAREHSLEMQLPFLQRVAPDARIVPLLMGYQTADTAGRSATRWRSRSTAGGRSSSPARIFLTTTTRQPPPGSTPSSSIMFARFDADGLQQALERQPEHACGGGPLVAVMRAAKTLGARDAVVLGHADSGDVSGDKSSVVGYLAAAFGTFAGGNQDRAR